MDLWLTEWETKNIKVLWKIRQTLFSTKSKYQKIDIVEFEEFGRGLVLDGVIQTTLYDEYIYHEMLTHVALLSHSAPRRVLVVGGGDGGTVREVLKHPVDIVDLVEIDGDVIDISKRYLPELAASLDDSRVKVHVQDALGFVKSKIDYYDCVLVDSSDPVGPAAGLFARPFFANIFTALKSDGLMAAQTESPMFTPRLVKQVKDDLKGLFPHCSFYWCSIPTYSIGPWSFVFASKKHEPVLSQNRAIPRGLRYYSAGIHQACFVLPNFFETLLET
jgi:spermidine synthase